MSMMTNVSKRAQYQGDTEAQMECFGFGSVLINYIMIMQKAVVCYFS